MGILIQGGNLFTASPFGTWREVPREAVSDPSSTASSCSSGATGPGPVTGDLWFWCSFSCSYKDAFEPSVQVLVEDAYKTWSFAPTWANRLRRGICSKKAICLEKTVASVSPTFTSARGQAGEHTAGSGMRHITTATSEWDVARSQGKTALIPNAHFIHCTGWGQNFSSFVYRSPFSSSACLADIYSTFSCPCYLTAGKQGQKGTSCQSREEEKTARRGRGEETEGRKWKSQWVSEMASKNRDGAIGALCWSCFNEPVMAFYFVGFQVLAD